MQNRQVRTIKAHGRVNGPAALNRLEQVLAQLRELHNACIYQYRLAEDNHEPDRFNANSQQKELTVLRAGSPELDGVLRRLQDNVIRSAGASWREYRKEKRGKPKYKIRFSVGLTRAISAFCYML